VAILLSVEGDIRLPCCCSVTSSPYLYNPSLCCNVHFFFFLSSVLSLYNYYKACVLHTCFYSHKMAISDFKFDIVDSLIRNWKGAATRANHGKRSGYIMWG
jgi:hypothetical protein